MPELTRAIVDDVLSACRQGSVEAAAAYSRVFDTQVQIAVGSPGVLDLQALPEGFVGPGLAVVLTVGPVGALVLLPQSTGLVPAWSADPDPTGQSRLDTLAQELGMLLLPDSLPAEVFKAAWLKNLAGALVRGGLSNGSPLIPLELTAADGRRGVATLVWPAAQPASVIPVASAKAAPQASPAPRPAPRPAPASPAARSPAPRVTPEDLPLYSRSLLRIQVPVVVTLARNRQPLGRIIELGPGSIIHFEKSCEEMLDLEVGGRPIAAGEAVKVGDKFGLRISTIVLPEERFKPILPQGPGAKGRGPGNRG